MYTLDNSRTIQTVKKLTTGPKGYHVLCNSPKGHLIVRSNQDQGLWMSVPQPTKGVKLYPMKEITELPND